MVRYKEYFDFVRHLSILDVWHIIVQPFKSLYVDGKSNELISKPDRYAFLLQYISFVLLDSVRLFWGLASFLYFQLFYMLIQRLKKAVGESGGKLNEKVRFVILFLIFLVPLYYPITGVRYWMALLLFVFGIFNYCVSSNTKYLLISGLSIFVHYSFLFVMPFLALGYVIIQFANRKLFSSIVLSVLVLLLVNTQLDVLQFITNYVDVFSRSTDYSGASNYLDENYIENSVDHVSSLNWYVVFRSKIFLYFIVIVTIVELALLKIKNEDLILTRLTAFLIAFLILSTLVVNLGHIGRVDYIVYVLWTLRFAHVLSKTKTEKFYYIIYRPFGVIAVLWFLSTMRALLYYVDPISLLMNPIFLLSAPTNISLSEYLIGH